MPAPDGDGNGGLRMKSRSGTAASTFRAARLVALVLAAACGSAGEARALGDELPPGWRRKTVPLEMAEGEHSYQLRTGWMSLRDFGEGDPPDTEPVLRLEMPDGAVLERAPTGREYAVRRMEVVGCGSGRMWVPPSQSQRTPDCQWIRFVWSIPAALAGARPGDVFPAVVVFDDYATHWMGGKFALRCGGKGRHADCDFCFSIVAGTGRGRPAASRSVPAGRRTPPEASDGSPGGAVFARPLTGTPVYATNAPPWSDGTIQPPADMLQAGTQVRILGRIPPCFFLVRYAGPKGETREGLVYESFFPSNAVPPEAAERP